MFGYGRVRLVDHGGHHASAFVVMTPGRGSDGHSGRARSGAPDVELYTSPRTNHGGTHPLVLDAEDQSVAVVWCTVLSVLS